MVVFLAVLAVFGNFFGFWAIPGLEGITTFQEKRTMRKAEEVAENRRKGLDENGEPLPPEEEDQ